MRIKKRSLLACVAALSLATCFTACSPKEQGFTNPGDYLGGGGTAETPVDIDNKKTEEDITGSTGTDLSDVKKDTDASGAVTLAADSITESGDYIVTGEHSSGITVATGLDVHLFLNGATVSNDEGVAISSDKKCKITLTLIGDNYVSNGVGNAIHIKGDLTVNGSGVLNVASSSKSAIKVSKKLTVVDATINAESAGNCISAESVTADSAKINITGAKKDGIHAELDYDDPSDASECVFTSDSGFVNLKNTEYTCDVFGDGIQADTFVYIDGGKTNITTVGKFVEKTAANKTEYGMTDDDFRYIKSGSGYQKVASDYFGRDTMYGLTQGCKGIKVGEIDYDVTAEDGTVTTYVITENADYSIIIDGGEFEINSTDDCIHANSGDIVVNGGNFTLNTCDDGLTADKLLKVNGGTIDVRSSYEGLEGAYVEINGGKIYVVAQDDGINAASDDVKIKEHIIIHDGEVYVNASGDGVDSNGSILIDGGTVLVYGPTDAGNGGLDSETGVKIDGGKVLVTSTLGMVETPATNSAQYVVSFAASSNIAAGNTLTLTDENDNAIFSAEIIKSCQSVIISLPELQKDKTYKLYGGDNLLETFTITQTITKIGTSNQFGPGSFPGGGFPGGGFPGGGFPGGGPFGKNRASE